MVDRMKVEGGKVTVEGGEVTSVDFVASDVILEPGVRMRNCTFDTETVITTAGGVADPAPSAEPVAEAPAPPPIPPLPAALLDAEL